MSEATQTIRSLGFGSTLDAIEAAEKAIAGVPSNPGSIGTAIMSVATAYAAVQMSYSAVTPLFTALEGMFKPAEPTS